MAPTVKKLVPPALPKGIEEKDLTSFQRTKKDYKYKRGETPAFVYNHKVEGSWNTLVDNEFELWYTEQMGWCIPTLLIAHARRNSQLADRTYAVKVSDGSVVRIGRGPHVLAQKKVYVRATRLPVLQKFLDLRKSGKVDAHEIRDRISTNRANGGRRRSSIWGW